MNVLTRAHMWPRYFLVGNSCGKKGEFLQKLGPRGQTVETTNPSMHCNPTAGPRPLPGLWRLQVPECSGPCCFPSPECWALRMCCVCLPGSKPCCNYGNRNFWLTLPSASQSPQRLATEPHLSPVVVWRGAAQEGALSRSPQSLPAFPLHLRCEWQCHTCFTDKETVSIKLRGPLDGERTWAGWSDG